VNWVNENGETGSSFDMILSKKDGGIKMMKDELPPTHIYVISAELFPLQWWLYIRFSEVDGLKCYFRSVGSWQGFCLLKCLQVAGSQQKNTPAMLRQT
jgi:hypothetical protein